MLDTEDHSLTASASLSKAERNKRYYEKKKAKTHERVELDYELDPKAKVLALKFMSDYADDSIFIHSYMENLNVLYYDWQKLPDVKSTTHYVS